MLLNFIKKNLNKLMAVQFIYTGYIFIVRQAVAMISHFLPIKTNKILIQSYEGRQFSCNPKYIARELGLHKDELNISIVAALKRPTAYKNLTDEGIKVVQFGSLTYYYHLITSKIVIVNDFVSFFIPKRSCQIFINTWHGGGAYKKIGISLSKNRYYTKRYKWKHDIDYVISSCAAFNDLIKEAFSIGDSKILSIGMPRNDILFQQNCDDKVKINERVRRRYNIEKDNYLVLYAPTYRESLVESTHGIDFIGVVKSLQARFGGQWTILYRGHYFLHSALEGVATNIINVSDYDDMQELLLIVDCLITDYSSSVWDFSFTEKPCFLFTPDLEIYKQEIGFYFPIEKWPFKTATDNKQLEANILNFDLMRYKQELANHHVLLGSFEKGTATKWMTQFIKAIINQK